MKFIITSLLTCLLLTNTNNEHLAPQVKQALTIPNIDNNELAQNAFIGLLAINAPANMEPQQIGKELTLKTLENYRSAIAKRDIQFIFKHQLEDYYTPQQAINLGTVYRELACEDLTNNNCLNDIFSQKKQATQFMLNNQMILDRYKKYIKLPYFNNSLDLLAGDYISLSNLQLMVAIYAINDNEVDKGLDILQAELNFYKRKLQDDKQSLTIVDFITSNTQLRTIYHVIASLLDTPNMAKQLHNPKLLTLLKPFTEQEQQILVAVLTNIKNTQLRILYIRSQQKDFIFTLDADTTKQIGDISENNHLTDFDLAATLNLYNNMMTTYIEVAKQVLPTSASYYQQTLKPLYEKKPTTLKKIAQQYQTNPIGRHFVEMREHKVIPYIFLNLYDTINYLTLVQTKLKIKQAGINNNQVSSFLQQLAEQASNPYNKQPFAWDAKTHSLSANWLILRTTTKSVYGEKAIINIAIKNK